MSAGRIVLVTGASGFVGRQVLRPLLCRGYEVHAVSRGRMPADFPAAVTPHSVDLLDPQGSSRLIGSLRPSHLLHLAWYVAHGQYWEAPENLNWTAASLNLIREFAERGGRRAVIAGSCAEYDWRHGLCEELRTPLNPQTLYGTCKNSLHAVAARYAANASLSLAWGRIFFLYGPHELRGRLVPSVILSLLACAEANCSHGRQVRDFLHVEDAGSSFAALLDSAVEGPVNIASGNPVSIAELVGLIGEIIGRPELVRLGAVPLNPDEPLDLRADVTRLYKEVGAAAPRPLRDGLRDAVVWWQKQMTA